MWVWRGVAWRFGNVLRAGGIEGLLWGWRTGGGSEKRFAGKIRGKVEAGTYGHMRRRMCEGKHRHNGFKWSCMSFNDRAPIGELIPEGIGSLHANNENLGIA